MEFWIALGVFWVVCGVISYGLSFAFFQREYPVVAEEFYAEQMRMCLPDLVFGPCALLASVMVFGIKHGLKFW